MSTVVVQKVKSYTGEDMVEIFVMVVLQQLSAMNAFYGSKYKRS